ncbi:sulfotransferase [Bacteroidota bacterium]
MNTASPFFVVGVPRSGTTLLTNRLNRHPDIYIDRKTYGPQFARFRDSAFRGYGLAGDVGNFTVSDWAMHFGREEPWLGRLSSGLEIDEAEGVRQLLARAVENTARKEGALLWGDKAPGLLTRMPKLLHLFPESKFVHIIRDGRAVAVSQRDRQDENLEYAIHNWKRMIMLGRLDGAVLGRQHYLEVRYEDLLVDPEHTARQILDFLGVEFDLVVISDSADEPPAQADDVPERVTRYVIPYFDTAKLNAWQNKLTPKQVRIIEHIGGDLLQNLGYELLQHAPEGPFETLTPWRAIAKTQGKLFRRLVSPQKTRKSGEDIIEVSIPFKKRLADFTRRSIHLYLSSQVTEQFRDDRMMIE